MPESKEEICHFVLSDHCDLFRDVLLQTPPRDLSQLNSGQSSENQGLRMKNYQNPDFSFMAVAMAGQRISIICHENLKRHVMNYVLP